MKKFFNRFGKRITSIFLTIIIIVISVITPFFTSSAFVVTSTTALAISALASLAVSLAVGIANGSAEEMTTNLVNDMSNYVDETVDNFNEFVASFFDGYELNGITVDGAELASYVDVDSGTASIQYSDYERLRSQFAGSLYKPESDLVDDYLSLGSFPVLYRGSSITMTVSDSLNLLNKYKSRTNSKGYLYTFLLALVNGKWCVVCYTSNSNICVSDKTTSGWCMGDSTSWFLSHTYILNGNQLTSFGTRIDGSTDDYSTGLIKQDVVFRSLNGCSVQTGSPSDVVLILSDNDFTASNSYSTVCSYISKYISDTIAITGTVETPAVDVENNELQNIIENGQGLGVVSENPTITFNPTTAEDCTTSVETLIDDVPVSDVENEIEDIQATADNIDGISGAISGAFPAIDLDIPFDTPAITDTSELQDTLEAAVKAKFPVIDQATTLLNNLFCSSYSNEPPNFHFYWDSDGDGEKERYNALDLSFFETVLTNENLEDKSRFSNPITVRSLVQGFIILIFYVAFALKIIKLLPTVFGGAGEGISDFSNIVGDK